MITVMSAFLHVMVNYRNDSESKAFVSSCLRIQGSEFGHFILANNSAQSSQDESFSELEKSGQVSVLNCPDNPGYFGAAQRVLKSRDIQNYKFVILSNTDLEIQTPDFYQKLLNEFWSPEVGAIAPSIHSELSQKESNPLYWQRPSKKKIHFLRQVYSHFTVAWLYHVGSGFKSRFNQPKQISHGEVAYAPHGCFLVLTNNYLQKNGDFAHGVRLYGEEIVLAEKLRQLGLKVVLWPELKITHREKGTEESWFHRITLSRRTFLFKQEAAEFLDKIFQ